ncbi:MAG: T9SS type A sorting domain-containing protein [Dysgonomonas sp.]
MSSNTGTTGLKTANRDSDNQRFELRITYQDESGLNIGNNAEAKLSVICYKNDLMVDSSRPIENVRITNLAGISVISEKPSNEFSYRKRLDIAAGVYIVETMLEDGQVKTNKIIVQ